jgi:GWxTD domain-containing protein
VQRIGVAISSLTLAATPFVSLLVAAVAPAPVPAAQQEESEWIEEETGWIEDEEAEPQGIPARGRGDFEFNLDSVSFLGAAGSTVQEFFLEVAHDQLTFNPKDDVYEAVARFELEVKNTETGDTAKDERVVRIRAASPEEASRADLAAVVISQVNVEPGLYTYDVRLTDLQARRLQLVDLFRGIRKHGKAKGYVEVKDLGGDLRLADVLLAREVRPLVSPSPYSRGELGIIPNPSHNYGLFQPMLRAYVEVYSKGVEEGEACTLRYSILEPEGDALATQTHEVKAGAERWAQVAELDLTEIPAGSYAFKAEVSSDTERAISEVPIEVLWDAVSWTKDEAELLQEMSFALTEDELFEFKAMSRGEREVFLNRFWREMDRTPGTAMNEVKQEFQRRIAYANAHFSETEQGIFTDRGKIYIRYGEPDDKKVQVIPSGGSSLDRVIDEEVQSGSMDAELMRSSRGGRADQRSYEIWYYNLRGNELFPHLERGPKRQVGMKFFFVDEGGYGNFILEHRTDD